jgi:poly(3-hydroxybutyrate) depolymerase
LILVFHGGGGNPEQVLKSTDIVDRAAREGWILVAPGGTGGSEVVQHVLLNQCHAWPGGSKGYRQGDEPTQLVSANALMFEFFKRRPKCR